MNNCLGCGIKKQNKDVEGIGYVLKIENDYCYRCFQIKHYNNLVNQEIKQEVFLDIIKKNTNTKTLFYYVLDVFDIQGTRMPELEKIMVDNHVVVIVNKVDLLPKSIKLNKILKYIQSEFENTNIKIQDFFLTSAIKIDSLDLLNESLKYNNSNQLIFCGVSNVGKSSIINGLLKINNTNFSILVSKYFNTTLDKIEIQLNDNITLIDTPGVHRKNTIANLVKSENWKWLYFKQEMHQFTYQLNTNNSVIIEKMCWLDYYAQNNQPINLHLYLNKELISHRTKTNNVQSYWQKEQENIKVRINDFDTIQSYKFEFKNSDIGREYDLLISGLGWFNFKVEQESQIVINIPAEFHENYVILREPLI